jgi:TolB protein
MKLIIYAFLLNFILPKFGFTGIFVKNIVKTNPGEKMYDAEPCWFEDGWSILFTRIKKENGGGGIWMMDIFGGEQPISSLNQKNYTFREAKVTSKGRKIVVKKVGKMGTDLLITEMDGEEIQKINREGELVLHPVWSPDGGKLVFYSQKENPFMRLLDRLMRGENQLWVFEIGGKRRLLCRFSTYTLSPPSFSPDGENVVFSLGELYIVKLDREEKKRLTDYGGIFNPIWSPTGERIAFLTQRHGRFDVFTIEKDGEEKRRVVEGIYFPFICFSHDGKRLLYSDKRKGVYSLCAAEIDGGGKEVLLQSKEKIYLHSTWSPAGDRVAVEVGSLNGDEGEIWILELDF